MADEMKIRAFMLVWAVPPINHTGRIFSEANLGAQRFYPAELEAESSAQTPIFRVTQASIVVLGFEQRFIELPHV